MQHITEETEKQDEIIDRRNSSIDFNIFEDMNSVEKDFNAVARNTDFRKVMRRQGNTTEFMEQFSSRYERVSEMRRNGEHMTHEDDYLMLQARL